MIYSKIDKHEENFKSQNQFIAGILDAKEISKDPTLTTASGVLFAFVWFEILIVG